MTIKGINEAVENEVKEIKTSQEREFKRVLKNRQTVGNKKFAYIPIELLFVDEKFQRVKTSSNSKINKIAREFDVTLMDPIRVSVHWDTFNFSVIEGFHRTAAAILAGIQDIEAEVLEFSGTSEEILEQEVNVFLNQDENREPLKAQQKHKANLIKKKPENVVLQSCLDKYKGKYEVRSDKYDICGLTGFCEALRIAKTPEGKEYLDLVFYVIFHSGWHMAKNGLGNLVIATTKNVLMLHNDMKEEFSNELIKYFTDIEPDEFIADALSTYPLRRERERLTMFLERKICEKLNIQPIYNGGNLSNYTRKSKKSA